MNERAKPQTETPGPHPWQINSQHSLFNLKLKDTWAYRDLLWLLVHRDFVSFYKQTVFGPLWFVIQPVLTTIIYTFIFGAAGISTDGVPRPLFYLAGITVWNFFADCLTKTSTVFKDNSNIFSKVYFPRLILPLSIVFSSLIRFGVQFILFLIVILYYISNNANVNPNSCILLMFVLIPLLGLLGLGLGMIISAMTAKYRDLSFLVTFGIQLLMYGSGVIIPLAAMSPKYQLLIQANPVTNIIETFRYAFLGKGAFTINGILYTALCTLLTLIAGLVIFNRVEKNFVDTV